MTSPAAPRDRQFARILCDRAAAGSTGILTATRGRLRRLFCMKNGELVFATSNVREEQFFEYLVRHNLVRPDLAVATVQESERISVKPIAYLLKSGTSKDDLRPGMEALVSELVTATLEIPDGDFLFDEGLPRLDDEITVRLHPQSLVLAHAQRHPAAIDALRIRIGPPNFRPIAIENALGKLPAAARTPLATYILGRCDGGSELGEILKDSPAPEEATLRAIYGLLLAGLVDPEGREAKRAREAAERGDVLTREECLGRLAMVAGQDHYGTLGIDRTARVKVIRDAYYALARRYHPDRFRSGPLADLLSKFEVFFMQVTDAHNTLSDPHRRAEYDEQLAAAQPIAETASANTTYLAKENFRRGRALVVMKKYTEAVTFFENAIKLDPRQADYHLELGLTLALNPRHREAAEKSFLRALNLAPSTVAAYVALGQMYLKAGKASRAARMAREALRWEPGHAAAAELQVQAGVQGDDKEDIKQGVFGSS